MKGRKTGGRQKGTPNKDNPLKGYLRTHSLGYFTPRPQVDKDGNPRRVKFVVGDTVQEVELSDTDGTPLVMSDHDVDMSLLPPAERVNAELRLLRFHTPEMKSVDMDMSVREASQTVIDHLVSLVGPT